MLFEPLMSLQFFCKLELQQLVNEITKKLIILMFFCQTQTI
jgi:hypothetical protein